MNVRHILWEEFRKYRKLVKKKLESTKKKIALPIIPQFIDHHCSEIEMHVLAVFITYFKTGHVEHVSFTVTMFPLE